LIALLKKLSETSLVLNVSRLVLAQNEHEIRENVVQWIESIRQVPDLDANRSANLMPIWQNG